MKNIEIEVRVKIERKEPLEKFLNENAEFKYEEYQKDDYYTPQHRDFLAEEPVKEWLRLRRSDKDSITYKNWHYEEDGKSHYCDEYESAISNINQMEKVFKALDIKLIVTVEKNRKSWDYNDYEISLDSIKNLGDFVEIEFKGKPNEVTPKKITDKMMAFLKEIGVGKIKRNHVGYPFMLLHPEDYK